jgi:hydrogenase maturation protease
LKILCIAIGNPLRGDDGAARRVLELVGAGSRVAVRCVVQLAPELAAEIAASETVLFIDADVACDQPRIGPVDRNPVRGTPLTHNVSISELVGLAERLYGFTGSSFVCRLPARAFENIEALSPSAEAGARSAAEMIRYWANLSPFAGNDHSRVDST